MKEETRPARARHCAHEHTRTMCQAMCLCRQHLTTKGLHAVNVSPLISLHAVHFSSLQPCRNHVFETCTAGPLGKDVDIRAPRTGDAICGELCGGDLHPSLKEHIWSSTAWLMRNASKVCTVQDQVHRAHPGKTAEAAGSSDLITHNSILPISRCIRGLDKLIRKKCVNTVLHTSTRSSAMSNSCSDCGGSGSDGSSPKFSIFAWALLLPIPVSKNVKDMCNGCMWVPMWTPCVSRRSRTTPCHERSNTARTFARGRSRMISVG